MCKSVVVCKGKLSLCYISDQTDGGNAEEKEEETIVMMTIVITMVDGFMQVLVSSLSILMSYFTFLPKAVNKHFIIVLNFGCTANKVKDDLDAI